MTLTVRLDKPLEAALERYCSEHGVTKSLVVQESLATYLVTRTPDAAAARAVPPPVPASDNFRAFAEAGLVGAVASGAGADKAAVRARMRERTAQRAARAGARDR